MASSGSSIGTVWVNVKPSLDGVQSAIQKGIQGTGTNISSSLGKEITKSTAMGVAVGGAILSGIKAIASKATDAIVGIVKDASAVMDSVIRTSNALSQMGYETDTINKHMQMLRNNANLTAASTGDLADGFLQLTASWKDIDLAANATRSLSDAILAAGGTTDGIANAITQISQVALDGPLDAQTWLSLRNSGLTPTLATLAEMNGIQAWMQNVQMAKEIKQDPIDDPSDVVNFDLINRRIAEIVNVPDDCIADESEVTAKRTRRAKQQQAAAMGDMLHRGATAINKLGNTPITEDKLLSPLARASTGLG